MNNLNQILIEGNLTRDPEFKQTKNGTSICNFSIATNRYLPKGDGEFTDIVSYFDVTVWSQLAESCRDELFKGRGVRIIGRLQQDRWEKDGKTNSRVIIVAEHIVFKPVARDKKPTPPPAPTESEEIPF
jgi:single-strand DNA-binding protein